MSQAPVPPDDPSDPAGQDPLLRAQAQTWVARLAGGDVDEEQVSALEAWLAADRQHAAAFHRERALWQDLRAALEPASASDSVGNRIIGFPPRRRLKRYAPAALAACLALFLAVPSLILDLRADHRSTAGEVRRFSLPDGTIAMLDSDSALSVNFTDSRRTVHLLAGRAWFDVHHEDRPFLVEARDGTTRDIGTSFEVGYAGDGVEVGVIQGVVQVHAPDGTQGSPIHTGERMRYTASGLVMLSQQPAAQLAPWRRGEILFDKRPIEAAITEVARYRSASVWMLGDFSNIPPVSGMFLIERPDEALETLARMRQLRIIALPGGYRIIRPAAQS